ncbi:MAG: DUF192 domain-containing protein [Candidatus Woesearchaeota archaeon]
MNNTVCFSSKCFKVEKVSTKEDLSKGLMYRTHLNDDSGMLFLFEVEKIYPFWMKNTYIPLDIIWVNERQEVVFIYTNALPCNDSICIPIYPNSTAKYVLEINFGNVEKYNIKIGDKVKIN